MNLLCDKKASKIQYYKLIFLNMIQSKSDLHEYLQSELGGIDFSFAKYKLKELELWFRGSESLPLLRFHYSLRHCEYYRNQKRLRILGTFKKHYWRFIYRHWQLKYEIFIHPNQCGKGLRLLHPGFRYLSKNVKMGDGCTILPMVLFGHSAKWHEGNEIELGNHVDISTGVTILGPIHIGNNVTIGAGAVVTKNIPDNVVIAGVPAKIIREIPV